MQLPSLKSAASEIVIRMYTKEKLRFDLERTRRPVETDPDFGFYFDVE